MSQTPYNPLDKLNLGKSVAEALLDQPAFPLGDVPRFGGAGIYIIYYSGHHPAYARLRVVNAEAPTVPIYVGKAIPSGGRKGNAAFVAVSGSFLYRRLSEHAESIRAVSNLDLVDFQVRWLVVDDIWIPLGETLIIGKFNPVWNVSLEGFGNHDPGAGRYQGLCPRWDTLHPGRPWAAKLTPRQEGQEDLIARVDQFLSLVEPPADPHIDFNPASRP